MCILLYLCDSKGDVAHVEPAGLPGHLAAHHGHGGGGDRQAVWGHGREESCGRDLASSWRTRGTDPRALTYLTTVPSGLTQNTQLAPFYFSWIAHVT